MSDLTNLSLRMWTSATAALPAGVQRVFLDALELAADEKIALVYGADYRDGKPCLVNSVAQMTTAGGGQGVPSERFRQVVGAFDNLNREFEASKVNPGTGYVSPLAAEILIRNFGEIKPLDLTETPAIEVDKAGINAPYFEPSDEYMAQMLVSMMDAPLPEELPETDDEYTKQHVEYNVSVRRSAE